jgi:hypothetical protein
VSDTALDTHRNGHRAGDRAGHLAGDRDMRSDLAHDGDRAGDRSIVRGRFQRGDSADPGKLVSVRIPAVLRDALDAERDRIEPDPNLRRSLDFYSAWVFAKGLEALRSVQPVQDPLA